MVLLLGLCLPPEEGVLTRVCRISLPPLPRTLGESIPADDSDDEDGKVPADDTDENAGDNDAVADNEELFSDDCCGGEVGAASA